MNSETLADIAREMRTYFQTQKRNGNPEHRPWHKVLYDWADRIEAAAQREIRVERTEAIDEALAHAEEVREAKCRNCERAPGNAAAMREALEEQLRYWNAHVRTRDEEDMRVRTDAALSAPPRNCDVGTAEEQTVRYRNFCNRMLKQNINCCGPCPCFEFVNGEAQPCTLLWAQMPYEAEGGAE